MSATSSAKPITSGSIAIPESVIGVGVMYISSDPLSEENYQEYAL
jgi:hypothetical protein